MRRVGSFGCQSMSSTSGGGAATITRLQETFPRLVCTTAPWSSCSILVTAARSATASPSLRAIRSGISCEPPTKRLSWAPLAVSELRAKVPTVRSLPEQATYQRVKRSESWSGSAPKPGWVHDLIRLVTPPGLRIALLRMNWPSVIASHCAAFGWAHGASTSISAAIESISPSRRKASGRIVRSGGTVPVYSWRPVSEEM